MLYFGLLLVGVVGYAVFFKGDKQFPRPSDFPNGFAKDGSAGTKATDFDPAL